MLKVINKMLGDRNQKVLKKLHPIVDQVNKVAERYQEEIKTHEDVLKKTEEFKKRIQDGESLDDLLPEAFALVKTACRHLVGEKWEVRENETEWNMVPYDVQILGGIALHQGNISEMKTGEGKTLVCTMPVYLNALEGKGAFVVTVNDYLAQRDAEWMGGLYRSLGLSIGNVKHGQNPQEKQEAYSSDITYGTNNEFGFDYLRDNMTTEAENIVQKELNYCIVDEVDSILVDEARTPLIISAPAEESTAKYKRYSQLVKSLQEGSHYEIDEKGKTAALTEEGIKKMEQLLGMDNIYTEAGFSEVHHLEQALRSQTCYKKDIDYLVKEGEIVIIDEFTGRLMAGRRYSHGLHQAIEAKESVEVKRESRTLASITFQNYFRMFNKLAGMTGTAKTEEEEFYQIYGLDVIVIPTNRPIVRADEADVIYKNQQGKYIAAANKIKELHQKGQPVLAGTISVEKSEIMNKLLTKMGVPHKVLNAKNHAGEAEIVKNAGQKGSVTIATNMAGRGTDIKLGEGVIDVGGLFILGTERHESRRIDNQLRGRAGRQGDPGHSQFFVSMEDDLMRLFGGEKIRKMMEMLKVPEDMPIENGMLSRSIESAQKKVEGHHFDVRKHVLQYDDVMNVHREIIYKRRKKFLESEDLKEDILDMLKEETENITLHHITGKQPKEWDLQALLNMANGLLGPSSKELGKEALEQIKVEHELVEAVQKHMLEQYEELEKTLPEPKLMRKIEKSVFLRANDVLWMEHIDEMQSLRESVSMRGYGQKDPLVEYKSEGFRRFEEMVSMIRSNTINTLFKMDIQKAIPRPTIKTENPAVVKPQNNTLSTTTAKAGRNDPCPCGSGKKYKKCCGQNS
ncbi:preprotein translocase subunit SecA [Candidatus Peregrinibacteria bacterium]|nr:preprotein translocase subunit SecA [Candidatus Peregrinibacteria bacterium]